MQNDSIVQKPYATPVEGYPSIDQLAEPIKQPGQTINVDGIDIHYERFGDGPQTLLLIPGSFGSTQMDFKPQLKGLNRKLFTVIALDLPGYGFSRPPDRTFPKGFFHRDAQVAANFMKALKFERYSIIGWSHGGTIAMILAAKNPAIERLIVVGANVYMTKEDVNIYRYMKDIDKWSPAKKEPMIRLYGEKYFRGMVIGMLNAVEDIYKDGGNICKEELEDITCPTLIVCGGNDVLLPVEHPKYVQEHIKGSVVKVFPEGKHNMHIRYAEEFNELVEKFMSETTCPL